MENDATGVLRHTVYLFGHDMIFFPLRKDDAQRSTKRKPLRQCPPTKVHEQYDVEGTRVRLLSNSVAQKSLISP